MEHASKTLSSIFNKPHLETYKYFLKKLILTSQNIGC